MMIRKVASAAFIAALLSTSALAQPIPPAGGGGGGGGGGSGDFSGPASSVDSNFVGFNGTGGKTGKDSGYGPSSFAPAGVVSIVTGSNPTTSAASWLAFTQYTIAGSGRTITIPASSTLSASGGLAIDANTNSVALAANAADTITWAGATTGTGGSVTLPAGSIYFVSTDAAGKIYVSGRQAQGNGAKAQLSTGSTTPNNCAKFDAAGNTVDAGAACAGGTPPVKILSGRWYTAAPMSNAGTHQNANTIWYTPIYLPVGGTMADIGGYVSTLQAGGNAQFQMYALDPTTNKPTGAPLCSSNVSQSTAATGNISAACGAVFTAGIWFLASNQDNNVATLESIPVGSPFTTWMLGADSMANIGGASSSNVGTQWTSSTTFGTWPTNPTVTEAKFSFAETPNLYAHIQ